MKISKSLTAILFLICSSITMSVTAQANKAVADAKPKQVVVLDSLMSKQVIKDLVEGDACSKELKVVQSVLKVTEQKVELQDGIIKNMEKQKEAFQNISTLKDEQLRSKDIIIYNTQKMLNRQKNVSWLWKAAAVVGTFTSGYLLIAK